MVSPPDQETFAHWRLQLDQAGIAWLAIDKQGAGTNVLSRAVMAELDRIVARLEADPPHGLVLWSAKDGGFVAGADIGEFPEIRTAQEASELSRRGQRILARLEALPSPSVAVLNGTALGGGLELALACRWRIGLPTDKPCLGLPEVQLGLHPGFGGTVRAVRLLGARRGMDLMMTGRSIRMTDALACGLLDAISSAEAWRQDAVNLLSRPAPRRKPGLVDRLLSLAAVRGRVARSMARQARRKAPPEHYPAPYAMIGLWREHAAQGSAAYEAEAGSFGHMAATATSRNLVRVFFLQKRLKDLAGADRSDVRRIHVIGAGIMGGDIAAWCALQGLTVTLQDRELKYVEPALARAHKLFDKKLDSAEARTAARARLSADVAGAGAADAEIVIEAIFENLDAKRALLQSLEGRLRPDCILATNTSSIPIEDIMTCLREPGRLIGLHFFNPVARLPLVEVVRTSASTPQALSRGFGFARHIGKLPLPCRSHPGFLVNRVLAPYLAEAMALAQEGAPLPVIDAAATQFGMPMGPIELADSVGLDIALHVARILAPLLDRPVAPELERLVAEGHLGQKTGKGFYVYHDGKPVRPRPSAHQVDAEVQDRLVLSLLNETAHCLDEGIVADADLIDAGLIFGTGFAPFRGGPLHYARERGIDTLIARFTELEARFGARFRPSPGWRRLRDS
jgi:3-hydroxyacyl-CoA dehydrogenase/enoyl-CoA hydratase/3-hydroxybutyryl-CoA epimerase